MIYRPSKGAIWDPSVLWHDGMYYAFTMYNRDGDDGLAAEHGWVVCAKGGEPRGVGMYYTDRRHEPLR